MGARVYDPGKHANFAGLFAGEHRIVASSIARRLNNQLLLMPLPDKNTGAPNPRRMKERVEVWLFPQGLRIVMPTSPELGFKSNVGFLAQNRRWTQSVLPHCAGWQGSNPASPANPTISPTALSSSPASLPSRPCPVSRASSSAFRDTTSASAW